MLALLVALPWFVWAVVRLGGLETGYVLVAAIALTPYAAATAWIPVVVALALRRRLVALGSFVVGVALVATVAPRALGGPQDAHAGGRSLSVLSANLRLGEADPDALMTLVREHDAEVLSLQELTRESLSRLADAGFLERFPFRIVDPRDGARGSGILSRHPLRDPRQSPPPGPAMPEATVLAPGAVPLVVRAVHPVAPNPGGMWRWERDLDGMPPATPDGPLRMLIGDFNATLDHERLRAVVDTGYADAADVAGDGLRPTARGIQIDRVLVDHRARVLSVEFADLAGSDHDVIAAAVSLPRA